MDEIIVRFRFPAPVLSMNRMKKAWWLHSEDRDAWREAGCQYALANKLPKGIDVPVEVEAVFVHADKRFRDTDNLVFTVKAVIDGLRDAGVLVEDDHRRVPRVGVSSVPAPRDASGKSRFEVGMLWLRLRPFSQRQALGWVFESMRESS